MSWCLQLNLDCSLFFGGAGFRPSVRNDAMASAAVPLQILRHCEIWLVALGVRPKKGQAIWSLHDPKEKWVHDQPLFRVMTPF